MSAAERLNYFPPLLSATFPRKYTEEEYLEISAQSEEKLEYVNGYIVPKFGFAITNEAGGSFEHANISTNTLLALNHALKGKSCKAYGSDLKIKTHKSLRFPDVLVVCDKPKFTNDKKNIITNPTVLVEIVSPESSLRDYVDKRIEYLKIESLQHYIIIEQERPLVSVFTKNENGQIVFAEYNFENPAIALSYFDIFIDLDDIYEDVEFGE